MNILDCKQGDQNWLAFRSKHFTASEAPAMLGLSKYQSRDGLLRQKATGIVPEVDYATQSRFDAGHAAEAATREWAEAFIGESLYQTTGTAIVDGLPLLASFDGLTADDSINWENKLWNESFAAQVRENIAPDTHWPQMEHQMIVSGASKVLFTVSDGADNIVSMWYESDPKRRAQVIAGWKMFAEDLANYQHVETKAESIGRAPDQLPALRIEVTGMVTASNLAEFKETALTVFRGINTNLQTDQDFADAEKAVKFCKDAEERLEAAKAHALSQTASIDDLFRTIDSIKEEARTVRLRLDKLVKAEKENRKTEIVQQAQAEYRKHIDALNTRIGGQWIPVVLPAFAESIKGLKSLDSMRDRISTTMANAKIEANEIADRIEANKKLLKNDTQDFWHLFPDFAQVCAKATEDFELLVGNRFAAQVERENTERAKIRAEEEAKATAKAKAEEDQRGKASTEDVKPVAQTGNAADREDEETQVAKTSTPPAPIDQRAAVVEHQDEIAAFMASREFKNPGSVRAILVEFVKFQSTLKGIHQ